MPTDVTNILLTGSTGFLGHYLLVALLRDPRVRCRVMLRPPLAASRERLRTLLAELNVQLAQTVSQQRVSLAEGELPDHVDAEALRRMDLVIHAAGNTSFDADATGEPARTNTQGTRALLDAATRARVPGFLLVSTAYVCGECTGRVPERVSRTMPPLRNDYERSKWQAERLVETWGRTFGKATICRPSILMGDRSTGRATTMSGLYTIARATEILARVVADDPDTDPHQIPLRIKGRPDATANVVPVCWAADQIASIALDPERQGRVHHLTNPRPPTHADIKAWLEEHFDLGGGIFVDGTEPLEDMNEFEDAFYSLGDILQDYFRHNLRFERADTNGTPPDEPLVDRELFFKWLRYARATNWMRSRRDEGRTHGRNRTVDPRWYFEQFLPRTIPRSQVARVEALTTSVRFVVTGVRGGEWICRFDRGRLVGVDPVSNGRVVEFGYRVSDEAFQSIVTGRKPLQEAFFRGRAEIVGNQLQALKMVSIMAAFLKEFPVAESSSLARS